MANTTNERLAKLEQQTAANGDKLERIEAAIYGNGKRGLLTEFQLLRQSVEEHHESEKELQKRTHADWHWIITTLVAVSAIVVGLLK